MDKTKKIELPTAEQLKNELDRRKYKSGYFKTLFNTLGTVVSAVAAVFLISQLLFPVLRVTGKSMNPNLNENQIILVNKVAPVHNGDIIAFYHNKKILIKRVIASNGDTINIDKQGVVSVNGSLINESYAVISPEGECDTTFPYTVPQNRFFVMGDDRAGSVDSRSSAVGCVAEENIIGKVSYVVLPFEDFKKVNGG